MFNELMCIGGLAGGNHLFFRRCGRTEADVVRHACGKQEGILPDKGYLVTKRGEGCQSDIQVINRHGAFMRIVKPQDQVQDCGFSAPRRADQSRRLSRLEDQRQVIDHRTSGPVAEVHPVKDDPPWTLCYGNGIGVFGKRFRLVKQAEHHPYAYHSGFNRDPHPGQSLCRLVGHKQGGHKGHKLARRRALNPEYLHGAQRHDSGNGESGQRIHQRAGDRLQARDGVGPLFNLADSAGHAACHAFFQRKGLDDPDAG